jgi:hypothetical protein
LQLPEFSLNILERFSDLLDLIDRELAAERPLLSSANGVNVDDAGDCVDSPPDAVRQHWPRRYISATNSTVFQ